MKSNYVIPAMFVGGMLTFSVAFGQTTQPLPSPSIVPIPGVMPTDATAPLFLVPRDTPIVVMTRASESSYSARTGAKIRYTVAQDAIVDGHIIAKAGDTAEGQVDEGQSGESANVFGGGYKEASLRVSVESVYNFCGDTVHVDFDRAESRRRQGAFGSNKDVHITKGQLYVTTTDRPQRVCTEITTAVPAPIPSDALTTNAQ